MEGLEEHRKWLSDVKPKEFSHVKGVTYLDHAGATLYSSSQLRAYHDDLAGTLYGNPHSQNPSSKLSADTIEQTRERVLNHFNTSLSCYDVVFTSGCTQALQILAESFPWLSEVKNSSDTKVSYLSMDGMDSLSRECSGSVFCYLEDNHTSVVGMREVAASRGAHIICTTANQIIPSSSTNIEKDLTPPYNLFVYPGQSNFCGRKYPLQWCESIPNKSLVFRGASATQGSWLVAIDAASLVSTSPLDLTKHPAHFVTLSFYKMFGFPTGIGALLVRRDCCQLLSKSYYGGGTVAATVSRERFHVLKTELHDRFEDGTVSFLSVVALSHGFRSLLHIGRSMDDTSLHTFQLAQYVYTNLSKYTHYNGQPVALVYCHGCYTDPTTQGPILNFNLVRPDGRYIGYSEVDKLACVYDIHLRTGCFCNTGACMSYLSITVKKLKEHLKAGHVCGDSMDIVDGAPTGSVRVSFGYMSTIEDADRLLQFIDECFVENTAKEKIMESSNEHSTEQVFIGPGKSNWIYKGDLIQAAPNGGELVTVGGLSSLTLYPVKSCSGQPVESWPLCDKGLLYDREWMVVSPSGAVISLKQEGRLCLIKPLVDIQSRTLTLSAHGHDSLVLSLDYSDSQHTINTRVCADRISGLDCGDACSEWLTKVLGRQCRLFRQSPDRGRMGKPLHDRGTPLSLVNEAQYLLISESSVRALCAAVEHLKTEECIERFRANFVVSQTTTNLRAYAEEGWERLAIGATQFTVFGGCSRCQLVCVDPVTGLRSPEPLRSLMSQRGNKVLFGVYLTRTSETNSHNTRCQ